MKLLYLTLLDFPRRVANRVQIMNMASAFARRCQTSVTVSKLHLSAEDFRQYYALEDKLRVEVLGEPRLSPRSFFMLLRVIKVILQERPTVVFVREEKLAWILSWLGVPYVYEIHDLRASAKSSYTRVAARSLFVVAISEGLKRACIDAGLSADKLVVVPDAVDVDKFSDRSPVELGADSAAIKIVYTGRFSAWKGIYTLLDATRFLPPNAHLYLIGGFEGEREILEQYIVENALPNRIHILDHQPYAAIAGYMHAADVLVVPNSGATEISKNFTSPLKLYEYMATGRPVVVSDLPSMREIVNDELVAFCKPDDPLSLADAIVSAYQDRETSIQKARAAREFVAGFTWDARAARILALVAERLPLRRGAISTALRSHDA